MNLVKIQNHRFTIPEDWSEVSNRQFKNIAPYLNLKESAEIRILALNTLLKRKSKKRILKLCKLTLESSPLEFTVESEGLRRIGELISWMWAVEAPDPDDDIHPIIKSFQMGWKKFHLPQESLNDVTVYEWAHIELGLQELLDAPEDRDKHLSYLAAVMCRPNRPRKEIKALDFDGYKRQYFNPEKIENQLKRFENLPDYICFALIDYIRRCQHMLRNRYEIIFQGESSDDTGFGWEGSIMSVGETQVFGTADKVKHLNIHDFCFFLSKKKSEQKRDKEKAEEAARRAKLQNS